MKDARRNRLSHMKTDKVLRLHYNMRLLERAKKLDVLCQRPRNTLKESLIKDMLEAVELEDHIEMDDEIEEMNMEGIDELGEVELAEEGPSSPE